MNKIKTIFKYEFLTTIKRKSFIIMTIAFPLLGLIVIGGFHIIQGISTETPSKEIKIGYVDQVGIFDNNLTYGDIILVPEEDQTKAFEDMVNGEISQYIVIPQDYLSTGNIARYTLEREMDVSSDVYYSIKRFLVSNILLGQVDDSIIERVTNPFYLSSITLTPEGEVAEQQGDLTSFIVPYIFSILLVVSIFTSSGFLLQGLGEEKENRVMEILLSSVSPMQLITGKVLGLGAAGLLQIVIWLISARFLADMASTSIGGMLSSLSVSTEFLIISLIYFILGYLLFAIIMAGAGSIGGTARESQQLSSVFTLLAVVPFFFITTIMQFPNSGISQFLTLFPLTAPLTVIMRMGVGDIPTWQILTSIALMILTIAGSIFIAGKIFRTFLLMYGKTPKLGEIIRMLRQA
jgi:ABC-2 type transport system permease protein